MIRFRWLAAGIPMMIAIQARADRLVLTDGRVLDGTVVKQTDKEVSFRMQRAGGITFTQRFDRTKVAKIETGPAGTPVGEARPAPDASVRTDRKPAATRKDPQALLEEVLSAWKTDSYREGAVAINALIGSADDAATAQYDKRVKEATGKTLTELAAAIHLADAVQRGKGGPISLNNVTREEREALGKLLETVIDEAIRFEVAGGDRPAADDRRPRGGGEQPLTGFAKVVLTVLKQTQAELKESVSKPAAEAEKETDDANDADSPSAKQTIVVWIADPENYDGNENEIQLFTRHVQLTASLLRERIRYDPRLDGDAGLKNEVLELQKKTQKLLAEARARSRGELTEKQSRDRTAERNGRVREELRRREAETARRQAERARKKAEDKEQQRDRNLRRRSRGL